MNIKIIFAILSLIIGLIGFFPYLRSVFKKESQPHTFTWLIWTITQGTATAGMWIGGAGITGAISLSLGTACVLTVFLLSLREGDKNITRSDIIVLTIALSAIGIWWFLKHPLLALIMVTTIDIAAYIPTFRKSYSSPWKENAFSWTLFAFANIFSIFAIEHYNTLTLFYISAVSISDTLFIIFLLIRRKQISKKQTR
ncbi:MAG: hypothetical protein P1V18_05410 [Candidatus Gracilibacteria bacterium]|nr:hypothetical protein [Candidatus Gracilibacteria bacterium]